MAIAAPNRIQVASVATMIRMPFVSILGMEDSRGLSPEGMYLLPPTR